MAVNLNLRSNPVSPLRSGGLLNMILKGEMQKPGFQRRFEWDSTRIANLADSLLKGYFVGSFVRVAVSQVQGIPQSSIKTESMETFKEFLWKGIVCGSEQGCTHWILDGQQRLTSLAFMFLNEFYFYETRGKKKTFWDFKDFPYQCIKDKIFGKEEPGVLLPRLDRTKLHGDLAPSKGRFPSAFNRIYAIDLGDIYGSDVGNPFDDFLKEAGSGSRAVKNYLRQREVKAITWKDVEGRLNASFTYPNRFDKYLFYMLMAGYIPFFVLKPEWLVNEIKSCLMKNGCSSPEVVDVYYLEKVLKDHQFSEKADLPKEINLPEITLRDIREGLLLLVEELENQTAAIDVEIS